MFAIQLEWNGISLSSSHLCVLGYWETESLHVYGLPCNASSGNIYVLFFCKLFISYGLLWFTVHFGFLLVLQSQNISPGLCFPFWLSMCYLQTKDLKFYAVKFFIISFVLSNFVWYFKDTPYLESIEIFYGAGKEYISSSPRTDGKLFFLKPYME